MKVFDNFYFVGQTEYSAWAVNTSDGIILIDTIYDYSVEDEVVNGLKKLGLDPSKIKYAIVTAMPIIPAAPSDTTLRNMMCGSRRRPERNTCPTTWR